MVQHNTMRLMDSLHVRLQLLGLQPSALRTRHGSHLESLCAVALADAVEDARVLPVQLSVRLHATLHHVRRGRSHPRDRTCGSRAAKRWVPGASPRSARQFGFICTTLIHGENLKGLHRSHITQLFTSTKNPLKGRKEKFTISRGNEPLRRDTEGL